MPDHVQLDLVETEVVLDLVDTEVVLDLSTSEVVLEVIGEVGPRGPQGLQGPPGPPNTSTSFYRHHQTSASARWLIAHDLPYPPAVTLVDSAGSVLYADVLYIDDSTIQVDFAAPTAGYAYCT